jgi:hypothetical protein
MLALLVLTVPGCQRGDEPVRDEATAESGAPGSGPHDGRDLAPADLTRVGVGDVAPDFTLPAYRGGTVTLSQYRGDRDVVLVFYRGHW